MIKCLDFGIKVLLVQANTDFLQDYTTISADFLFDEAATFDWMMDEFLCSIF